MWLLKKLVFGVVESNFYVKTIKNGTWRIRVCRIDIFVPKFCSRRMFIFSLPMNLI